MLSLEDVYLQTYESETLNIFCLVGSAQQAQQSTHLDEGLNPL